MRQINHLFGSFLLFIALIAPSRIDAQVFTQQNNGLPKLGLALSGGGAKGLAHIGLLRILDSLEIKPDYITGTSMGAIMGALYATGYSGDDLKAIALNADWTGLLSNKLTLSDINIEEKDEYQHYALEVPLVNGKLTVPKGIIEGQTLQNYLIDLTFAVRHIHQFDKLPIPFHCVASDINTGKSVVITEGSLPDALRASMSIPLAFTPIEKDSLLLVDGGLTRNFPVKEVRDMGATTVIGSYTGFRVLHPEELKDGSKIILQSLSLSMYSQSDADKNGCDVLINNELPQLYASDFKNVKAIIEGGEANAREMLPQLIKIAEWQHRQKKIIQNPTSKDSLQLLPLERVDIHPSNTPIATLLKQKFGIEPNQVYTKNDVKNGMLRLYGSRFFSKINLNFTETANKSSIIQLHAQESPPTVIKLGVHYDTDDAAGILANATFRNLLGFNSRLVVTTDLAEHPKGRLHYYQFIGNKAQFRWTFELIGERTVRNDFLFIKASEGRIKSRDKYLSNDFAATLGLQAILNTNTFIFAQIGREYNLTKPQRDPRFIPIPDETNFLKNESNSNGFTVGIDKNTFNHWFFPTKGHRLHGEIKLGFGHNSEFVTYRYNDTTKLGTEHDLITSRNQAYIRYILREQFWYPITKKLSFGGQISLGAGFSLNKNLPQNHLDTIPLDNPETFYIGGKNISLRYA